MKAIKQLSLWALALAVVCVLVLVLGAVSYSVRTLTAAVPQYVNPPVVNTNRQVTDRPPGR